ncbi:MAG: [FeFe] hydrogenase H-cluster maturation GTPase HydF, partial [Lachnospiraceae bacterium]
MSLNSTPSSERVHIAFFGLRNVGKSSLVNAVTGQDLSLVSDVKGTTTDPVKKAMELLPLGPVVIIDTPGMDDEGSLGSMRVARARKVLAHTDIAVLVTEAKAEDQMEPMEEEIIGLFRERALPYVIAYNKSDLLPADIRAAKEAGTKESAPGAAAKERRIYVSAIKKEGIWELKEMLADFAREWEKERRCLVSDLVEPGGTVVLVVPIDESAPKGRLILPQQHVMRDLLDAGTWFMTCQPEELTKAISQLKEKPALVITDSQAFRQVSADLPDDILLTSFSILFARYKGELEALVEGAKRLSELKDGDRVLISEGCTHHRQCNDLGTVK